MRETDAFSMWFSHLETIAHSAPAFSQTPVDFHNPLASYALITWQGADGTPLRARVIRPRGKETAPVVLMFHDAFVPVRGWHHMTRFIAAGFGVFALENRGVPYDIARGWQQGPEYTALGRMEEDAASAAAVMLALPWAGHAAAWGEGLGGALALVTAALRPDGITRCAALNPLPCDVQAVLERDISSPFYRGITDFFRAHDPERNHQQALGRALAVTDPMAFAPRLSCPVLLGTGGMDAVSPPFAQEKLWKALTCETRRILYPKHAHERINDFEDELLKFLHGAS